MTNIKMHILDMSGTTINENNLVYKTVQKAIQNEDIQVSLGNVLEHGEGKEKYTAIVNILHTHTNLKEIEINEIAPKVFQYFNS